MFHLYSAAPNVLAQAGVRLFEFTGTDFGNSVEIVPGGAQPLNCPVNLLDSFLL